LDPYKDLFLVLFTVHLATLSRFEIKSFLKFVTALRVSPYSDIIRCTAIAVERKAQQFPPTSTHLIMAEYAETYSAVTALKRI
jgi:hypothetical protein